MAPPSAGVLRVKKDLAEILLRSRLDYTDGILILNAFLRDFRWRDGATAAELRGLWRELLDDPPPRHMFSVYIHVPYCRRKCHFCYCAMEVASSQKQVDDYVPEVVEEILHWAPLFKGVTAKLLQVGGGTPSLLSVGQLESMIGCALDNFEFDEEGIKSIEFNPASTTRDKLRAVARLGFNRVSFGVQTLEPRALKKENREYQTYEMVRDCIEWASACGIETINVDLLLGLAGSTVEGLVDTARKIARLKPACITITGLSLTDAYMRVAATDREVNKGRYQSILPEALRLLRLVARECGYDEEGLAPEHRNLAMNLRDRPASALRRLDQADHYSGGNESVLGLGRYGRSYVFGRAAYERHPRPFEAGAPSYRVTRMNLKEEMARYLLYAIENRSRVEFRDFQDRFREDVRDRFQVELKALKAFGQISLDRSGFSFLPEDGTRRIFYGLFFLLDTLAAPPYGWDAGGSRRAELERDLAEIDLPRQVAA